MRSLGYFRAVLAMVVLVIAFGMIAGCNRDKESPTQPSGAPPVIALFAADTTTIAFVGQGTYLRWEVQDKDALVRIDPMPGNVGNVGSAYVVPSGTVTYTLVARNVYGSSQRFVTVRGN